MKSIRSDISNPFQDGSEHDACAIYLSARKQGQSTFGTLKRALGALINMGHRTGFVNGEGDGAGVQTDIPRRLWAKKLSQAGMPSYLATHPGFWVGHLFVPATVDMATLQEEITQRFQHHGVNLLLIQPGRVRKEVLGQHARINPPQFWQIAGYADLSDLDRRLLHIQTALEEELPLHFASLSRYSVVYKMRGSVEALTHYYPDLQDHNYDTSIVLCHARYSTNTVSTFERAQPFAVLGHNGEINTINRLRLEAVQIGCSLPKEGSDSQDLDRLLHTLCVDYELDLIEAMETVFPPIPDEIEQFPPDLKATYQRIRQAFGPYAQGPAAILSRFGNTVVASVDALGLRPLWFIETEKEYIFSSERGATPLENWVGEARALAPGEKVALILRRGENPVVLDHAAIRQHVMVQTFQREAPQLARQYWSGWGASYPANAALFSRTVQANPLIATAEPSGNIPPATAQPHQPASMPRWVTVVNSRLLAANGWLKDHFNEVDSLISENKDDLISSLGYDGPLAPLSKARVNLADYFKEAVAVVTNPSIDHVREMEAFSTSSLVGACPAIGKPPNPDDTLFTLEVPILTGGLSDVLDQDCSKRVAEQHGTVTIKDLISLFADKTGWLTLAVFPTEDTRQALQRLADEAVESVQNGAQCLILDDQRIYTEGLNWLDPHLAVSMVDQALRNAPPSPEGNLRRRTGLVVRSAAIRTLHDIALLIGFGADAVNPYAMFALAAQSVTPSENGAVEAVFSRLVGNLKSGLEKVTSTMGCHELRGYGRVFGSIGLAPSIARIFGAPNYFGSEECGMNWQRLDEDSRQRGGELRGELPEPRMPFQTRIFPKFWKTAHRFAKGEVSYADVQKTFETIIAESPVALRHLLHFRPNAESIDPEEVDLSIRDYDLPFVIDAMSYGSQGESSFKSYIHAASLLNIVCINGEGGELPEILGKYRHNRGQQVASGRFGVNAEFLNSAAILEIKIGQGAKPGEGGMLPGYKVTPKVAQARRTPAFVTLLSPSNNHDLYSIEDLAQLIEELKMVNPQAKISVKVPVVPGIGVIAVGIAKAGADIINISGYDGGTGAARKHSLQYAGLPTEIGLIQAHRALVDAGIRHKVELWANGGMKTGADALKMILLGANRVGFATMAMVALGCTICRQCNLGTCHVGIATQIQTVEEAREKGLKHYVPLHFEEDHQRIVRLFKGIGQELRELTAKLGAKRVQDLVGRADLLEQSAMKDQIDLSAMFDPLPVQPRPTPEPGMGVLLIRPRNSLTTILTDLILRTVADNEREVTYQDTVSAIDRALGSRLAGELIRQPEMMKQIDMIHLRFGPSALAGNGFAAWNIDKLDVLIEGGAQDGVAKGASGGRVAIMKGLNHDGIRLDGSVGKSFAYGAQDGILIVQGNADSRACVRLSGAKVILAGEIIQPVSDPMGNPGTHANLKGFACEYMTSGTVIILGDPGPYAFSGMTGGVVYQKLTPEFGFDEQALKRRIARGAQVRIQKINEDDLWEIRSLMSHYLTALEQTYQYETAERLRNFLGDDFLVLHHFVKVVPTPLH
ncbi:MAG: glutamate synthase-related protein [Chloroflexota bacterium]